MERGVTTILFIAANPATTSRLALDEEARTIANELRMATSRDAFRIRAIWAARPIELLRELGREPPTIVHFSGHAEAAGIVLVNEHGDQAILPGDSLANLLATVSQATRLVILNACSTDKQSEALVNAIGCAITMTAPLGDACARRFSRAFYAALGEGQSVRHAFDQAVALLNTRDETGNPRDVETSEPSATEDRVIPVLRYRPDVSPEKIRFVPDLAGKDQNFKRSHARIIAIGCSILVLTLGLVATAEFSTPSFPSECDLVRINDVEIVQGAESVAFDVTIHNLGNRAASITRLQLGIACITTASLFPVMNKKQERWTIGSHQETTAKYHLRIRDRLNEIGISHVLASDGVDRIEIVADANKRYRGCSATASLRLKYNASCFTEPYQLLFATPFYP